MRIAVIGTTADTLIAFRAEMIQALICRGHTVYAFSLDYVAESEERVKRLGAMPVSYTFSRSGLNPVIDIINTLKLARQLKSLSPDLVFTYFSKPAIFGSIAARLAGVEKKYAMLEGLGFLFTEQPQGMSSKTRVLKKVQVFLYRLSFPLLDSLILLNADDEEELIKNCRIPVSKVDILGGIGVTLSDYPFSKPPVSPITFLFVGRLLVEKGVREFVSAAKMVTRRYPNVRFTIIGGLDSANPGCISREALNEIIDEGIISYFGQVADVREYLRRSSVFVLPSYREGLPRSTQEAMAVGRAVITTDVPGCRDTVIDGVNGFIVPPWSSTELAEKMTFFIRNPHQIELMGMNSYQIAQDKYDAEVVNERLLRFLEV